MSDEQEIQVIDNAEATIIRGVSPAQELPEPEPEPEPDNRSMPNLLGDAVIHASDPALAPVHSRLNVLHRTLHAPHVALDDVERAMIGLARELHKLAGK